MKSHDYPIQSEQEAQEEANEFDIDAHHSVMPHAEEANDPSGNRGCTSFFTLG